MKWLIPALLPAVTCMWITVDEPARPGTTGCPRSGPEYIGVNKCKPCHFQEFRSWQKTPMALAFKTLAPGEKVEEKEKFGLDPKKDYTKDVTCLECHTTGYGKPGGYPVFDPSHPWTKEETERAKDMQGVQCEVCHGPGSEMAPYKKENEKYARKELLARGLLEPKAELCAGCHNERSPSLTKDSHLDYDAVLKDPTKVHKRNPLKHPH